MSDEIEKMDGEELLEEFVRRNVSTLAYTYASSHFPLRIELLRRLNAYEAMKERVKALKYAWDRDEKYTALVNGQMIALFAVYDAKQKRESP